MRFSIYLAGCALCVFALSLVAAAQGAAVQDTVDAAAVYAEARADSTGMPGPAAVEYLRFIDGMQFDDAGADLMPEGVEGERATFEAALQLRSDDTESATYQAAVQRAKEAELEIVRGVASVNLATALSLVRSLDIHPIAGYDALLEVSRRCHEGHQTVATRQALATWCGGSPPVLDVAAEALQRTGQYPAGGVFFALETYSPGPDREALLKDMFAHSPPSDEMAIADFGAAVGPHTRPGVAPWVQSDRRFASFASEMLRSLSNVADPTQADVAAARNLLELLNLLDPMAARNLLTATPAIALLEDQHPGSTPATGPWDSLKPPANIAFQKAVEKAESLDRRGELGRIEAPSPSALAALQDVLANLKADPTLWQTNLDDIANLAMELDGNGDHDDAQDLLDPIYRMALSEDSRLEQIYASLPNDKARAIMACTLARAAGNGFDPSVAFQSASEVDRQRTVDAARRLGPLTRPLVLALVAELRLGD